jgi:hypothetical protein
VQAYLAALLALLDDMESLVAAGRLAMEGLEARALEAAEMLSQAKG